MAAPKITSYVDELAAEAKKNVWNTHTTADLQDVVSERLVERVTDDSATAAWIRANCGQYDAADLEHFRDEKAAALASERESKLTERAAFEELRAREAEREQALREAARRNAAAAVAAAAASVAAAPRAFPAVVAKRPVPLKRARDEGLAEVAKQEAREGAGLAGIAGYASDED